MTDWLCCIPITNTTLWISSTPKKSFLKNQMKQNLISSHHLCCHHSGLSCLGILSGLVQQPFTLSKKLVRLWLCWKPCLAPHITQWKLKSLQPSVVWQLPRYPCYNTSCCQPPCFLYSSELPLPRGLCTGGSGHSLASSDGQAYSFTSFLKSHLHNETYPDHCISNLRPPLYSQSPSPCIPFSFPLSLTKLFILGLAALGLCRCGGPSLVAESGGHSLLRGFSCRGAQAPSAQA